MRKPAIALACIGIILLLAWLLMPSGHPGGVRMETVYLADGGKVDEENEEYDGPAERDSLEFMKTVDPTLGYVPYERMQSVMERAIQEDVLGDPPVSSGILWEERGPIRDIVGPSNGNLRGASRANLYYTAGRIRAVLPDTLNDPSGNTVFAAGVAGGLWKCSNFWSGDVPNWTVVNDYFVNMAISSICQDPTNPQVMYFSTGEPTSNADAVIGGGFWKTTDGGNTWFRLPASEPFVRTFKLVCDASGNVYAALRPTVFPREQPFGLVRSKDGGVSWENITPSNLTSANNVCTDLEFSAGGRLHAAFGYLGGTGTVVNHLYLVSKHRHTYCFLHHSAPHGIGIGWQRVVCGNYQWI
jgi:hypothetical protein